MKYNNGDIDDLFRRAAEGYPLRTDSADWNRLASDLDEETMPISGQGGERRKRRGAVLWFLLLPLAGAGYLTWQAAGHHSHAGVGGTEISKTAGSVRTTPVASAAGTRQAGAAGNDRQKVSGAGAGQGAGTSGTGQAAAVNGARQRGAVSGGHGDAAMSGNRQGPAIKVARQNGDFSNARMGGTGRDGSGARMGISGRSVSGAHKDIIQNNDIRDIQPGNVGESGNAGVSEEDHQLLRAALDLRRAPTAGDINLLVDVRAPVIPAAKPEAPPSKPSVHRSHVYIGLSAAPDFSTVKLQPMKGVGTTVGLLLGYAFNDRWAVETGLYLDRKRYYTDGEYFNTSKVRLQPNYNLLNVDGTCYMWEIPVNVRYNFGTGPGMRWFGTAGVSTYLMSKENYTYQYDYTSGGTVESSHWNIDRPSQYWFTILNLSAGFEQRIGKIGNLRLEPYIRIPLSGIGTGNLPIASAGLNIGLTHRLW